MAQLKLVDESGKPLPTTMQLVDESGKPADLQPNVSVKLDYSPAGTLAYKQETARRQFEANRPIPTAATGLQNLGESIVESLTKPAIDFSNPEIRKGPLQPGLLDSLSGIYHGTVDPAVGYVKNLLAGDPDAAAREGGKILTQTVPGVYGAAEGVKAAAPAVFNQASKLAPVLEKSAAGNFERILNPTKDKTKFTTQKITPELAKRGVAAWTETQFRAKIMNAKAAAGRAVDAAWEKIPVNEKLPVAPLADAIDGLKAEFTAGGVDILPDAVAKLDELKGMVQQFGNDISPDSMRKVRQLLDQVVDESSGFGGKDLKTTSQVAAQKQVANLFRRTIGDKFPDVKAANSEFTFWSNVDDVMNAKELRDTGKNLNVKDLIAGGTGATAGALHGGAIAGPLGVVVGPALVRFMQSTAWRTTSAAMKMHLARLLEQGKYAEVVKTIGPERQLSERAGGPFAMGDGSDFSASPDANQLKVTTGPPLRQGGYADLQRGSTGTVATQGPAKGMTLSHVEPGITGVKNPVYIYTELGSGRQLRFSSPQE